VPSVILKMIYYPCTDGNVYLLILYTYISILLESLFYTSFLFFLLPEEASSTKVEISTPQMRRSFTLEEATDTILLCSSIVHDVAYKAATIAIEKESLNREVIEEPRATITGVNYPTAKSDRSTEPPLKRIVNARKVKRKRHDTENTTQSGEVEGGDVKDCNSLPSTGDSVHKNESLKPPQPPPAKLEGKCNCTIM
jgi:hypothetical protein